MLVVDLADDLLDEVLERHDTRRAAVLVDDDGELHASLPQLEEQRVQPQGLGDEDGIDHEGRDRHVGAPGEGHRDGLLDVDDAVDVVPVRADDGEPGVPRAPGECHEVGGGGRALDRRRPDRGVMTSAAVWSENPRDAVTSRAVPRSRVPASAEVRTREASSAGLRAADSSSWGSMPIARRVRFATPLRRAIIGFVATANHRTGAAATLAVGIGRDTARVLGTISPKIIEKTVASSIASTAAADRAAPAESPSASRGPRSSAPIDGLAMKPRTRVVSVIPSWHADSWVESWRWDASTERAPRSPSSTERYTAGRSRATRANSAATNNAVPRVRTTPRSSSSHSVMVATSYVRRHGIPVAPDRLPGASSAPRVARIHRRVDPPAAWGCEDRPMTPEGTP